MHHVLLCVQPKLLRDSLRQRLSRHPHLVVVGEVDDDIDLLLAIRATDATLVIHSWPSESMPAMYSHLFAEYPGLKLLGLTPRGDHLWHCEQRVVQTPVNANGLETVLSTLPGTHTQSVRIGA
jgi:DNA-binding NarL/FixJ family response regulator